MLTEEQKVNHLIKDAKSGDAPFNTNLISDGYHTFGELYEHRVTLFIALCKMAVDWSSELSRDKPYVWASKKHSDGTEWKGWFLMGIGDKKGEQITYHLPIEKFDECCVIAQVIEQAPDFDGHTSADVLERLAKL